MCNATRVSVCDQDDDGVRSDRDKRKDRSPVYVENEVRGCVEIPIHFMARNQDYCVDLRRCKVCRPKEKTGLTSGCASLIPGTQRYESLVSHWFYSGTAVLRFAKFRHRTHGSPAKCYHSIVYRDWTSIQKCVHGACDRFARICHVHH